MSAQLGIQEKILFIGLESVWYVTGKLVCVVVAVAVDENVINGIRSLSFYRIIFVKHSFNICYIHMRETQVPTTFTFASISTSAQSGMLNKELEHRLFPYFPFSSEFVAAGSFIPPPT